MPYVTRQRIVNIIVNTLYLLAALLFTIGAIKAKINPADLNVLDIYVACSICFLVGAIISLTDTIIP